MLTLEKITKENWRAACFLTTNADQHATLDEKWVAGNAFSLLQECYDEGWHCRLICADGAPVGFVFYGIWQELGIPLLCRYMIDVDEQGKGYGKAALPLVIEMMYQKYGQREIYVSVHPDNARALKLYIDFGFLKTELKDEEEDVYRLPAPEEKKT